MCRRFSGKARNYMLGYKHQLMENKKKAENVRDTNGIKIEQSEPLDIKPIIKKERITSYDNNERIHKQYSSHRDANCVDWKFIQIVMHECIHVDETEYAFM